jgi:hypothetical protein
MPPMRPQRKVAFVFMAFALLLLPCARSHAQAALLLEQPYGFFGALNPTGHTAIYFQRVCAETPVRLRRCRPGELGAVISRYEGMDGYDWIAMPLLPYLYSTENVDAVPVRTSHEDVERMRDNYHEAHLMGLGDLREGNMVHGGWKELVGVAYERRIYAFRFDTTEAQDDGYIAQMNDTKNKSHFQLFFSNCADFSRVTLNYYFPGKFKRSAFPDAGVTTPKQVAYKLVKYGKKHPSLNVEVYEIPQVPGYRRPSGTNKDISEALITTGYALPIAVLNPYLAGALLVDYIARGHHHLVPKDAPVLSPENLALLTQPSEPEPAPAGASGSSSTMTVISNDTDWPSAPMTATPVKAILANHE